MKSHLVEMPLQIPIIIIIIIIKNWQIAQKDQSELQVSPAMLFSSNYFHLSWTSSRALCLHVLRAYIYFFGFFDPSVPDLFSLSRAIFEKVEKWVLSFMDRNFWQNEINEISCRIPLPRTSEHLKILNVLEYTTLKNEAVPETIEWDNKPQKAAKSNTK